MRRRLQINLEVLATKIIFLVSETCIKFKMLKKMRKFFLFGSSVNKIHASSLLIQEFLWNKINSRIFIFCEVKQIQIIVQLTMWSCFLGKWHGGYHNTDYLPNNRGFDTFRGILLGMGDHYTHIRQVVTSQCGCCMVNKCYFVERMILLGMKAPAGFYQGETPCFPY